MTTKSAQYSVFNINFTKYKLTRTNFFFKIMKIVKIHINYIEK